MTEHPNFPVFATRLYALTSLIGFEYFTVQIPDIKTFGNLENPTDQTEKLIIDQVHSILVQIYVDYELQINLSSVTVLMESLLEVMHRSEPVSVTEKSALSAALSLSWDVVKRTPRS